MTVAEDGKDALTLIAELGQPDSSIGQAILTAVSKLAVRKKEILAGITQPPIDEVTKLSLAAGGLPLAINILLGSVNKLHKNGIIPDEVSKECQRIYAEASEAAQRAVTAIAERQVDAAKGHIVSAVRLLIGSPDVKLIVGTLEDSEK